MANKLIDELTQIVTIATGDQMYISDVSESAADKSKKITIQQLDDRYDPASQTGVTPVGEMYQFENAVETAIGTQHQWEHVINFTEGETSFVTFASNTFTATIAGKYLCVATVTAESVLSTIDVEFAVSINDVIQ
jgi:hypothetical protein